MFGCWLDLAADQGIGRARRRSKRREREIPRERTLSTDEFRNLQKVSDRSLQRVHIGTDETAMGQALLLAMTWDPGEARIERGGGRQGKAGARQRVGISPALAAVLAELCAEYRRIPNAERKVFTRGGKPILVLKILDLRVLHSLVERVAEH